MPSQTLVAADAAVPFTYQLGTRVVRTPLDLIIALEESPPRRVVLAGRFAHERCFAAFIREYYPTTDVQFIADRADQGSLLHAAVA